MAVFGSEHRLSPSTNTLTWSDLLLSPSPEESSVIFLSFTTLEKIKVEDLSLLVLEIFFKLLTRASTFACSLSTLVFILFMHLVSRQSADVIALSFAGSAHSAPEGTMDWVLVRKYRRQQRLCGPLGAAFSSENRRAVLDGHVCRSERLLQWRLSHHSFG